MSYADPKMQAYYASRASEYERIYAKPERQPDLRRLERLIPDALKGRRVIEVACGTGYWTQHLAPVASFVLATDTAAETLEIARSKPLPEGKVEFAIADAFDLPVTVGQFSGAYAGFWWSHLRPAEAAAFYASLRKCLSPGAVVVLMDNLYVEGSSTPISRTDSEGNTWQTRKLDSGATHEVLKNFPRPGQLEAQVAGFGTHARYLPLDYYWLFQFEIR